MLRTLNIIGWNPTANQGASVIASFFSLEAGDSGGHVVNTVGCENNSVQKAGSTVHWRAWIVDPLYHEADGELWLALQYPAPWETILPLH